MVFMVVAVHPPPLEDGYIHARYIANHRHGLGLVLDVGEHSKALTSPPYSYGLLALSRASVP